MRQTPNQRLATTILGRPLEDFVLERRPDKSWRLIARDLHEATNGQVDVTGEALRGWYRHLDAKPKATSAA